MKRILKGLEGLKVVGADIVEVAPSKCSLLDVIIFLKNFRLRYAM